MTRKPKRRRKTVNRADRADRVLQAKSQILSPRRSNMRNSKMFKMGSFEEELAKGMETKLVSRQTENQFSFDRIAKAVDFINAASQIFDDTGFYTEAEVLTKMLERI